MEMTTLRVLSYNIHKGFNFSNRQFVLERIRQGIRETGADLVLLQEVLGEHKEHGRLWRGGSDLASQFEYLADGLWPHFAYGKNSVYDEGDHGNALLSRFPIVAWNNENLSTNRWEQRGLLHVEVALPGASLHALVVHLDLLGRGRRKQVARICEYALARVPPGAPLLLAGDFNDWRRELSHELKERLQLFEVHHHLHGYYAKTFPSFLPLTSLDRIYVRGLEPARAEALSGGVWQQLSDHLALYAEFKI